MPQDSRPVNDQPGVLDNPLSLRYIPAMREREPTLRELLERLDNTPSNRVLAAVGYIPFLCFLPMFTDKEDDFARFHGRQSLILLAALVGCWVLIWLLDVILGGILSHIFLVGVIFKVMGWLVHYVVGGVVSLSYFIGIIFGAVQALAGRKRPIPFIGVLARQLRL
jgi:uncharacterized membrane protein